MSCTISLFPLVYLPPLLPQPLLTSFHFFSLSLIDPYCAIFALHENQIADSLDSVFFCFTYFCMLCTGSLVYHLWLKSMYTASKNESPPTACQPYVGKHLPLSLWVRWKYVVHDMGLLNSASWWTGAPLESSWDLERHFAHRKKQKSKGMQTKMVCFTVKMHNITS